MPGNVELSAAEISAVFCQAGINPPRISASGDVHMGVTRVPSHETSRRVRQRDDAGGPAIVERNTPHRRPRADATSHSLSLSLPHSQSLVSSGLVGGDVEMRPGVGGPTLETSSAVSANPVPDTDMATVPSVECDSPFQCQ
ncbi:hypothetical protein KIPB_008020, partial [Kipferlia bialata]|eukprot:g8020.t1